MFIMGWTFLKWGVKLLLFAYKGAPKSSDTLWSTGDNCLRYISNMKFICIIDMLHTMFRRICWTYHLQGRKKEFDCITIDMQ